MIGATGSRHLNSRRRGSSPNVSPHLLSMKSGGTLATQAEEDETVLEPELPPGMVKMDGRRRRAVNTTDYKTCVLLHAQLKGLNLGDVAINLVQRINSLFFNRMEQKTDYRNDPTKRSHGDLQMENSSLVNFDPEFEKIEQLSKNSSAIVQERRKKRKIPEESFVRYISNVHRKINPNQKISKKTVQDIDDLLVGVLEKYKSELKTLSKIRTDKTLTAKRLELATMLCLPKPVKAVNFANNALKKFKSQ